MRKTHLTVLTIFCFLIIVFRCPGQGFDYVENSVYVYNFIKYTSWPQKTATIQIGIIGTTPLEGELKHLFTKKTNSNVTYTIRKIVAAEAKSMDVVIVAQSASGEIKSIAQQTTGLPILIISEKEDLNRLGACISFFIDEDNDYKTGYQLSIRNCKARGLSVSEQILNNAVLTR